MNEAKRKFEGVTKNGSRWWIQFQKMERKEPADSTNGTFLATFPHPHSTMLAGSLGCSQEERYLTAKRSLSNSLHQSTGSVNREDEIFCQEFLP